MSCVDQRAKNDNVLVLLGEQELKRWEGGTAVWGQEKTSRVCGRKKQLSQRWHINCPRCHCHKEIKPEETQDKAIEWTSGAHHKSDSIFKRQNESHSTHQSHNHHTAAAPAPSSAWWPSPGSGAAVPVCPWCCYAAQSAPAHRWIDSNTWEIWKWWATRSILIHCSVVPRCACPLNIGILKFLSDHIHEQSNRFLTLVNKSQQAVSWTEDPHTESPTGFRLETSASPPIIDIRIKPAPSSELPTSGQCDILREI